MGLQSCDWWSFGPRAESYLARRDGNGQRRIVITLSGLFGYRSHVCIRGCSFQDKGLRRYSIIFGNDHLRPPGLFRTYDAPCPSTRGCRGGSSFQPRQTVFPGQRSDSTPVANEPWDPIAARTRKVSVRPEARRATAASRLLGPSRGGPLHPLRVAGSERADQVLWPWPVGQCTVGPARGFQESSLISTNVPHGRHERGPLDARYSGAPGTQS
mmetsp:Transcript_60653/g.162097  ORF Transcript_60653/g.162097 Transcript_60653/m.162097 type:complete len:213 (+) Transcript_60653:180-818(+)